jgi:hypothetical protein
LILLLAEVHGIEPTCPVLRDTLVLKTKHGTKLIRPQTLDSVHGTALVEGLWVFDGSCRFMRSCPISLQKSPNLAPLFIESQQCKESLQLCLEKKRNPPLAVFGGGMMT